MRYRLSKPNLLENSIKIETRKGKRISKKLFMNDEENECKRSIILIIKLIKEALKERKYLYSKVNALIQT